MSDVLRIHMITSEDPFYLPAFFREFFVQVPRDRVRVTGIDVTPPLNQKRSSDLARKLYRFYGAVDFGRLTMRYAAARLKDLVLPATWPGTVPRIAALHGVPCRTVPQVNADEYVAHLRALDLDLLVSVAASQIFKEPLLCVARLGSINIHTGPLPQYRGMMPVFWQLRDGRPSIGITVHTMTPKIDLGEIVRSRSVPINGFRTLDSVTREMKHQGARVLADVLRQYADGTVSPMPMVQNGAGYRSFPTADDAAELRRRGYGLL